MATVNDVSRVFKLLNHYLCAPGVDPQLKTDAVNRRDFVAGMINMFLLTGNRKKRVPLETELTPIIENEFNKFKDWAIQKFPSLKAYI